MSHTIAINSWITKESSGALTLFSKDRNIFSTPLDSNLLKLSISSDFIQADLYSDSDPTLCCSVNESNGVGGGDWMYIVYSLEMLEGYKTSIELYLNNRLEASTD